MRWPDGSPAFGAEVRAGYEFRELPQRTLADGEGGFTLTGLDGLVRMTADVKRDETLYRGQGSIEAGRGDAEIVVDPAPFRRVVRLRVEDSNGAGTSARVLAFGPHRFDNEFRIPFSGFLPADVDQINGEVERLLEIVTQRGARLR